MALEPLEKVIHYGFGTFRESMYIMALERLEKVRTLWLWNL